MVHPIKRAVFREGSLDLSQLKGAVLISICHGGLSIMKKPLPVHGRTATRTSALILFDTLTYHVIRLT